MPDTAPPVASFTWSPPRPVAGAPVAFRDASSGTPVAWSWSFGDGTSSDAPEPTHRFPSPGAWPVTLEVGNSWGSDQVTCTVEVGAPARRGGARRRP